MSHCIDRAQHALDLLMAMAERRRNTQRAIIAGNDEPPKTTVSTPDNPAVIDASQIDAALDRWTEEEREAQHDARRRDYERGRLVAESIETDGEESK